MCLGPCSDVEVQHRGASTSPGSAFERIDGIVGPYMSEARPGAAGPYTLNVSCHGCSKTQSCIYARTPLPCTYSHQHCHLIVPFPSLAMHESRSYATCSHSN